MVLPGAHIGSLHAQVTDPCQRGGSIQPDGHREKGALSNFSALALIMSDIVASCEMG